MSTRSRATAWLKQNYPETTGKIRASKLYAPEESWTKSRVWWFEFAASDVQGDRRGFTNLLCEQSSGDSNFSLVKILNSDLIDSKDKLYLRDKRGDLTYSLYLSAEDGERYIEQRGSGNINFSSFVHF